MRTIWYCGMLVLLPVFSSSADMIKPGQVLEISVANHEEFSGMYLVREDGTIEYPLLAGIPITSIGTTELMQDLTIRLAKYVDNPMVSVKQIERPEIEVTVLGRITTPGPVKTHKGASLQEVIHAAGGSIGPTDLTRVKIMHKGESDRDARFYNLRTFLDSGRVDDHPRMQDGDLIVLMSKKEFTKVKVIGAVKRPGFFEIEQEINIFEIVYLAGGPDDKADLSRVRRFFKHDGKTMEEVIDLKGYIDDGEMDNIPLVQPGDVIIVYSKWFDWKTLLTILNNSLLFIVTVQAFSGVFDK